MTIFYRFFNAWKRSKDRKGIIIPVLILLMILMFFLIAPKALGAVWETLIIDDFESYNSVDPNNALEGQGPWYYAGSDHNVIVVQEENVLFGQKAIGQLSPCNQETFVEWATTTKILDGSQWFSLKTDYVASADKDPLDIRFREDSNWNFGMQIHYDGYFRAYYGVGQWYGLGLQVVQNKWYDIHFEWRSIDEKFRISIYDSLTESQLSQSIWLDIRETFSGGINKFRLGIDGRDPVLTYLVLDHFSDLPSWEDTEPVYFPSVYFDTPSDYSEISASPLEITGHFENFDLEIYDAIRLVGCSTETMRCIVPQDFEPTGSTGNFDFTVLEDLTIGFYTFHFNIVSDYWIYNPANSPELNLNFLIDFATTSPPYIPSAPEAPELKDPYIYYFENTEYETTTAIFNSLTNSFGAGFIWIYNLLDIFDYFQLKTDIGQNIGEAISTGRAYVQNLNSFFNLPIVEMFFLYISVLMIVGILRFIKYIRNLLPFI